MIMNLSTKQRVTMNIRCSGMINNLSCAKFQEKQNPNAHGSLAHSESNKRSRVHYFCKDRSDVALQFHIIIGKSK